MKKIKLTCLLGILCVCMLNSQVAINTHFGKGIFHIDSNGDNTVATIAGSAETTDDVIITSDGRVGFGTISPSAKLDIVGLLQIEDGTQLDGAIFTSKDNLGTGNWQLSTTKIGVWQISHPSFSLGYGAVYVSLPTTSTSLITINEIGLSLSGNNALVIPKGKYLISVSGGFTNRHEAIDFRIAGTSVASFYYDQMNGLSFFQEFSSPTVCTPQYYPAYNFSIYPHFVFSNFTGAVSIITTILKLD